MPVETATNGSLLDGGGGDAEAEDGVDDAPSTQTSSTHASAHYWRHWACFATMGVLHNLHYSIVLASAYSLASAFSALPLIGLIQWATVILAIVVKLVNGLYLLGSRADQRLYLSLLACMLGLSVLSLTVSLRIGFWLALLAICVIRGYGAMSESVVLAYLNHFPGSMLSAWGAGTGGSGVTGTFLYLLLHGGLELDNRVIYLLLTPACLVYMAAFSYVQATADIDPSSDATRSHHNTLLPPIPSNEGAVADAVDATHDSSGHGKRWSHALEVSRHVSSLAVQLALVYLFEFVILVGLASQANPQADGGGWWYDNAYEVLSFCYQLGMLDSRSSIGVVQFKVRQLPWLTALQAANSALWLVQAWRGLMPLWLQFTHMLLVGLLGGAMYVNVFHLVNRDAELRRGKDRELAINLITAAYNVGLVGASIVETVLLNTVLTRQR